MTAPRARTRKTGKELRSGQSPSAIPSTAASPELAIVGVDAELEATANEHLRNGEPEKALETWERLCSRSPAPNAVVGRVVIGRGHALRALKRYDEALECSYEALELDSACVEALNLRGLVLADLGSMERAIESYNEALSIRSNFTDALVNRGRALEALKRFDDARQSYDQAIAISVDCGIAREQRDRLAFRQIAQNKDWRNFFSCSRASHFTATTYRLFDLLKPLHQEVRPSSSKHCQNWQGCFPRSEA